MKTASGRCMCGAMEFTATIDKREVTACHCGQCRKWSGHVWASVNVPFASLEIVKGKRALGWFRSSEHARRGFCKECGSALFWHADKLPQYSDRIAIAAGTLDEPTGLALAEHIFVADKGDYYEIADGKPQLETH